MGQRGPKRLSSQELQRRGSKLYAVRKLQETEETAAATRRTVTPPPAPPKDLQVEVALDFWNAVTKDYILNGRELVALRLCCDTLQRHSQIKFRIYQMGVSTNDKHQRANELLKAELAYATEFISMAKKAGFFS